MTDLLLTGGTVVTADGSRRADVAISNGRVESVDADLSGLATRAREVVDASGLFVLPGAVDVHTHVRMATDAEPDRFFQDSVAAAFGGTTTFLAFTDEGPGSSATAGRSVLAGLAEWRAATDGDSAVDYGLTAALSGRMDDPIAELPALVDAGVPTAKAYMVFDQRLDDRRIFDAIRVLGERGGMLLVHCEDPVLIDAAVAAALQRGDMAARYHATTRPTWAEGVATARAIAFARMAEAPVHLVHLSTEDALRHVREGKELGVRISAATCPHYLTLTDERYGARDEMTVARYLVSPPLRSRWDEATLWAGIVEGDLDVIATNHIPDRLSVEKADAARGVPFDRLRTGMPGIETLLALAFGEGVGKGRCSIERMVDVISTTPARRFGLDRKGAIEVGKDADIVLLDPSEHRTLRAADLHHASDYTPYEGFEVAGVVRGVWVRGSAVVRDGTFVGERGYGRFVGRSHAGDEEGHR